MTYSQTPEGKDPQLWATAQKIASFKRNLATYFVVNAFLWIIWLLSGARTYGDGFPWPVWPTLGWGIGLLFNYLGAYVNTGVSSVDKEYNKLSNKQ
jgi:hypothetical protein